MPEAIIRVKHLSHIYKAAPFPKKALNDISLEIVQGDCVAIIGFNGSGKSTLVQHLNGLLRPTQGSIWVDGIDIGVKNIDLRALRQRVGMLFQFPESQLFGRTVYTDVAFGPQRMKLGRHEIRTRVKGALNIVGLPHEEYGWRSPFELSGGQRRRVALAGILAMSPRILILDEPTVGLDGEGRSEFYSYLQHIQREQGVTIILVSHDMAEVAAMADWLYILHQGNLVQQGTPRTIFAESGQLHAWDLAVPPLHALLEELRQLGIAVSKDLLTVDEAFTFLQKWKLESSFRIAYSEAEADHPRR
ncbi:energy-coupling factor transporter ATP-binding protein EcfA [Dictyobacter alpinus]|uniref:Energy-coupling factor transporter ATP-binding protein EcfA2 n=1 Tax=Dictyobacter alpinus TaxID=2014873 RepID=A0A402AZM7_9CHLR|nr:energy-coupling factor transporter ATPase [Dictyobacter alpinus]GCE24560.1 energy-coupling factor transporter ATP-binding protein EcfA [Dictyobacter alpinus]